MYLVSIILYIENFFFIVYQYFSLKMAMWPKSTYLLKNVHDYAVVLILTEFLKKLMNR